MCDKVFLGVNHVSLSRGRNRHHRIAYNLRCRVRFREYRKFLAGAFFVSSGMQIYFYLAKIPIPLMGTNAIQSPELSGVRGTIHFVLFLICLYFGWFFHRNRPAG